MRVVIVLNIPLVATAFRASSLPIAKRPSTTHLNLIPSPPLEIPKLTNEPNFIITSRSYKAAGLSKFDSESNPSKDLVNGIREWLIPSANAATTAAAPPTAGEVKLLRDAFGALYGERNPTKAEELLSQAIKAWERQAPDERAGLYRVRGDCFAGMLKPELAVQDFTTALDLLYGPGGELADQEEIPAARLGRARAQLGVEGGTTTKEQYAQAAEDYQVAFRLTAREDWDTNAEREEDGATRNPYAAWEWGMARRGAGDFKGASESHTIASRAFREIGDRPRSVISALDAGIDLAASDNLEKAKTSLEKAIKSTTSAEGNDIELLQRVVAKEGEARIALASILWGSKDTKPEAEDMLFQACARMDQLQVDADARKALRVKKGLGPEPPAAKRLKYTIDDTVGPEASCTRYKNQQFLSKTLLWPESLQEKVAKLNKFGE